jgi:signal transduction histidine kinase
MSDPELIRVLLVEDDDAYAALVTTGLQSPDTHIALTRAATLAAALDAIAGHSFDAILLDPVLPDSDGLSAVGRIHATASRTAIVVLTSNADDRVAIAAVQHGAQECLVKHDTDAKALLRALHFARERTAFQLAQQEREARKSEQALRATAEQLRQAAKMEAVGRLAGGVAHDFNNVLTAIFGYVDLLLDQFGEHDPRRPDLQEIRHSAERAASLTRQLLAFSRKQVLQPRIINVNGVIEGMQALLVRLVTDDVTPWLGLAPDVWQVRVDPGQIEQVLMNLAANARDAMPEGGRLGIETANVVVAQEDPVDRPGLRRGEYVLMTVSDTGQGMPEEVRTHIFEPFFTTKAQGKGTGLGLATVYGIVKQSGGGVYVESREGAGTRFLIYLPRVPSPSVPRPA